MLSAAAASADIANEHPGSGSMRTLQWIAPALLLLVLLLVLPSPAKFHGDERFYTDAAIHMVQSGDYWTPVYPDGQIRLLKPILTYWAVAGSMKLFGIGLFGARLPFALAGMLTVLLTSRLARTIGGDERASWLAPLILVSNIQMLTLSARATPDALVCLFVLMSVWGFARIWFASDASVVGPLLVYGGMGLAVQTKGLLGLCPAAAAALFWWLARPDPARTRRLFHVPAILVGVALGGFWYVVMLREHGLGSLRDFFSDQVGAKVTYGPALVLGNLATYAFAGVRHFLPWTILPALMLVLHRQDLARLWRQYRRECLFLLSLFTVLLVVFSFGNMRRTRYLVAAYPMLAVVLALIWSQVGKLPGHRRGLALAIRAGVGLLLLLGAGLVAGGVESDRRLLLGGAVLLGLGVAGVFAARAKDQLRQCAWIALVVVGAFGVVGLCVRPTFSREPVTQVAARLQGSTVGSTTVYSWQTPGAEDALLRLVSGGRIVVKPLDETNPRLPETSRLLTIAKHRVQLEQVGYNLTAVTATNAALADSWLGRLAARIEARRRKPVPTWWIAEKPPR